MLPTQILQNAGFDERQTEAILEVICAADKCLEAAKIQIDFTPLFIGGLAALLLLVAVFTFVALKP